MLQVEGADEEVHEEAREQERPGAARTHQRADAEDAHRHQWVLQPRLQQHEYRTQPERRSHQAEGVRRRPPVVGRGHDAVNAEDQRCGDQDGAKARPVPLVIGHTGKERDTKGRVARVAELYAARRDEVGARFAEIAQLVEVGRNAVEKGSLGTLGRPLKLRDDDGDDHACRKRSAQALQEATDDEVVGAL